MAGVPDSASVDLSLIKLPEEALMFPNPPALGELNFVTPRYAKACDHAQFKRRASRLGFPNLRFHDLRGTHETLLLDRGVPVHVVAARCGHDPATLLRILRQANTQGRYQRGQHHRQHLKSDSGKLKNSLGPKIGSKSTFVLRGLPGSY